LLKLPASLLQVYPCTCTLLQAKQEAALAAFKSQQQQAPAPASAQGGAYNV